MPEDRRLPTWDSTYSDMSRYRLSAAEQARRQALRISKHQDEAAKQVQRKLQSMQENIAPFLEAQGTTEYGASSGSRAPAKRMHMTPCFASKVPTGRLLDAEQLRSPGGRAAEQIAPAGAAGGAAWLVTDDPLDEALEAEIDSFFRSNPSAARPPPRVSTTAAATTAAGGEDAPQYRFLRRVRQGAPPPRPEMLVCADVATAGQHGEAPERASDEQRPPSTGADSEAQEDGQLAEHLAWWRRQGDLLRSPAAESAEPEQPEEVRSDGDHPPQSLAGRGRGSERDSLELDGRSEWFGVSSAARDEEEPPRPGDGAGSAGAGSVSYGEMPLTQGSPLCGGSSCSRSASPKRDTAAATVAATPAACGSPAEASPAGDGGGGSSGSLRTPPPRAKGSGAELELEALDTTCSLHGASGLKASPACDSSSLQTPAPARGVAELEASSTASSLLATLSGTQAMSLSALIAEQAAALAASAVRSVVEEDEDDEGEEELAMRRPVSEQRQSYPVGGSPRRRLFDGEGDEAFDTPLPGCQLGAPPAPQARSYGSALQAQAAAEAAAQAAARAAAQIQAARAGYAAAAPERQDAMLQDEEPSAICSTAAGQEFMYRGSCALARATPRVVVSGPGPGRSPFSAWPESPGSSHTDSAAEVPAMRVAHGDAAASRTPAAAVVVADAVVGAAASEAVAVGGATAAAAAAEAVDARGPAVAAAQVPADADADAVSERLMFDSIGGGAEEPIEAQAPRCNSQAASPQGALRPALFGREEELAAALALTREWACELGVVSALEDSARRC